MKKIILLLLLFFSYNAYSQYLYINNSFSEPLYVCVSFQTKIDGWQGWVSQGWTRIIPGERKAIVALSNIFYEKVYVYAQTSREVVNKYQLRGSSVPMIVDLNHCFYIQNCFSDYVLVEHPEYAKVYPWIETIDISKSLFSKQKDQTIFLDRFHNIIIDTVPEAIEVLSQRDSTSSIKLR